MNERRIVMLRVSEDLFKVYQRISKRLDIRKKFLVDEMFNYLLSKYSAEHPEIDFTKPEVDEIDEVYPTETEKRIFTQATNREISNNEIVEKVKEALNNEPVT